MAIEYTLTVNAMIVAREGLVESKERFLALRRRWPIRTDDRHHG